MDLRRVATRSAECLDQVPSVQGVLLFGSVARGDFGKGSDVDLLVVSTDEALNAATVRTLLPHALPRQRVSAKCLLPSELAALWWSGSPFAFHLRLEGRVLLDRRGGLRRLTQMAEPPRIDVGTYLESRLLQLGAFDDLSVFRGNLLFALSGIYVVGRSVVMLLLAAAGAPQFNRDAAFRDFQEMYPAHATDIDAIAVLKPFFLRVKGRREAPLPFSYRHAEEEARIATKAIGRIAWSVGGELLEDSRWRKGDERDAEARQGKQAGRRRTDRTSRVRRSNRASSH